MIYLEVWLTLADGERLQVGELVATDPDSIRGGAIKSEFRYLPQYLRRPDAFALDPVALPLSDKTYPSDDNRSGVHSVFEDSLPDDWGRQMLARRHTLPRHQQRVPHLLVYMGDGALGALSYRNKGAAPQRQNSARLPDLPTLLEAARLFEQDPESVQAEAQDLRLLFQAGSSPGGARPKVLIEGEEEGSCGWIAKFPSARDRLDVVRLEAAAMALARRCDMRVADTRLIEAAGVAVLLVKRFDQTEQGGRRHMVSMKTLLQAQNYYSAAYGDLGDIVRRYSDHPQTDLLDLYRWLIFNATLGNTDDHLKNIMMQHDDEGWRLTPFYDLLPNINQNLEHVLQFETDFYPPDKAALIRLGGRFGFKRSRATAVVEEMHGHLKQWRDVFADHGVPEADGELMGRYIKL